MSLDFEPLTHALIENAPVAIYAALVGTVLQLVFATVKQRSDSRDMENKLRLAREKFEFQSRIETQRFEHQVKLDKQKFEYEQVRWREKLSVDVTMRQFDARLEAYPTMWSLMREISGKADRPPVVSRDQCRAIAKSTSEWRFGKGGLVAEDATRQAALAFERAVRQYNSTTTSFGTLLDARRLLRAAMRSDLGLGTNVEGGNMFDAAAERQRIVQAVSRLQIDLDSTEDLTAA